MIAELQTESHERRLELVNALCRAVNYRGRAARSSPVPGLPHEFLKRIAVPTLMRQREIKPNDAYATLWLALIPNYGSQYNLSEIHELIDLAYELSPTDPFVCERAIENRMRSVEVACHHLPEGLLATPEEIFGIVDEIYSMILYLTTDRQEAYRAQAQHFVEAVNLYVASHPNAINGRDDG